jgi:hypothetical protein
MMLNWLRTDAGDNLLAKVSGSGVYDSSRAQLLI